jgi:hypothetical protein
MEVAWELETRERRSIEKKEQNRMVKEGNR